MTKRKLFLITAICLIFNLTLLNLVGCSSKKEPNNVESEEASFDEQKFLDTCRNFIEIYFTDDATVDVYNDVNNQLIALNSFIKNNENFKISDELLGVIAKMDRVVEELELLANYGYPEPLKNSIFELSKCNDELMQTVKIAIENNKKDIELPVKTEGLVTKYGSHTYGCKTQEEYDEVIKVVEKFVNNLNDEDITKHSDWILYQMWLDLRAGETDIYKKYSEKYGHIDNSYPDNVEMEWQLALNGFMSEMNANTLSEKISDEEFENLVKAYITIAMFKANNMKDAIYDNETISSTSSAYEALFKKINNKYSDSQIKMAILDTLGYNTALIVEYEDKYRWVYVNVGGLWFEFPRFSSFAENISDFDKEIFTVYEEPTIK